MLMDNNSLKSISEKSGKYNKLNNQSEAEDDYDRKTRSRATSNRDKDTDKVWTTAEILADKELWEVTDSSGDSDSVEEDKG